MLYGTHNWHFHNSIECRKCFEVIPPTAVFWSSSTHSQQKPPKKEGKGYLKTHLPKSAQKERKKEEKGDLENLNDKRRKKKFLWRKEKLKGGCGSTGIESEISALRPYWVFIYSIVFLFSENAIKRLTWGLCQNFVFRNSNDFIISNNIISSWVFAYRTVGEDLLLF